MQGGGWGARRASYLPLEHGVRARFSVDVSTRAYSPFFEQGVTFSTFGGLFLTPRGVRSTGRGELGFNFENGGEMGCTPLRVWGMVV